MRGPRFHAGPGLEASGRCAVISLEFPSERPSFAYPGTFALAILSARVSLPPGSHGLPPSLAFTSGSEVTTSERPPSSLSYFIFHQMWFGSELILF